jgi:membrane carboxypeptidase/penicillin-binding protein PbpC
VLPSAVRAWLEGRERRIPEAPELAPECAERAGDAAIAPPSIVTPGEGQVVTLIPGVTPGAQKVALTASTRAAHLSWFVDGALIETAPAGARVFWIPTAGKHELVVRDDAGRKARRLVEVRDTPAIATQPSR